MKNQEKKFSKKRKRADSKSTIIESEEDEEVFEELKPSKKYCILHRKCSHSMDRCKYLLAMVNKNNKMKKTTGHMERAIGH